MLGCITAIWGGFMKSSAPAARVRRLCNESGEKNAYLWAISPFPRSISAPSTAGALLPTLDLLDTRLSAALSAAPQNAATHRHQDPSAEQ